MILTRPIFWVVILLLLVLGLGYQLKQTLSESKRKSANYESLIGKTKETLELSKSELKDYFEQNKVLEKSLVDLNVKIKDVQSVSQTITVTKTTIKTELRDTIIYLEGEVIPIEAQSFTYDDPWTNAIGLIYLDSINIQIASFDTLTVIGHYYKSKKFPFKIFERKKLTVDVTGVNPKANYKVLFSIKR